MFCILQAKTPPKENVNEVTEPQFYIRLTFPFLLTFERTVRKYKQSEISTHRYSIAEGKIRFLNTHICIPFRAEKQTLLK